MRFRIDRDRQGGTHLLRLEGTFIGREAARLLSLEVARIAWDEVPLRLDVAGVHAFDEESLGVLAAGLGRQFSIEGGGDYLKELLSRRLSEPPHA